MPPRHAYWTILIDGQPTAFRAREREELQPTLVQLQRKSANVTMRWFARGKLWDSREAEQADFQQQRRAAIEPRDRRERPAAAERRGSDWRPGGTHKDPRDRFKKKNRPERAWSDKDPESRPFRPKPQFSGKPRERKPWDNERKPWNNDRKPWHDKPREDRPRGAGPATPSDRPWQKLPTGPRAQRQPFRKPTGDEKRPWSNKPPERKPWQNKPGGGPPRGDRPREQRNTFDNRKREGGWSGKPWKPKPAGGPPRGDRPRDGGWRSRPRTDGRPPRRRDDDD